MRSIESSTVDAIISDPPYATTDLEWDCKVDWSAFWCEAERICKETALVVLFSAQPFTTTLINSNRKHFRYELIWAKTTSTGFLDANRRPLRAHENILIFSRRFRGTTYNPQKTPGKPYTSKHGGKTCDHYTTKKRVATVNTSGERHPKSWMLVARDNYRESLHPTQKPVELMKHLVLSYSNPGDLVFDPFMGSGTTGVACKITGRSFIGSELNSEYYCRAVQRLTLH